MQDYSMFVPNVHFEQIPIKNLVSNQEYQRSLSQAHIVRAAENFDLYQINPVKVSRRDGVNYVFNGQHTIEIVALVSGSRDTPVWCMIYDDLSYQHEADIFANQMKFVKPLKPCETFKANVEAGAETQLIIKNLVESYGLSIASGSATNDPKKICAVSTLEKIINQYGYHVLDRVLRLSIATWEGEQSSFSSKMLNALTKLVVAYGDDLNDALFKEKLSAYSVKSLMRNARERRPGSIGLAEVLVINYNGKKKNPQYFLKMNKLNETSRKLTVEAFDKMLNEEARHYNMSEDDMNFDPAEGADPAETV